LIIINLLNGRSAYVTAEALGLHNTTVYRVAKRFRAEGEGGLFDGREDNVVVKVDERYLSRYPAVSPGTGYFSFAASILISV
jgi:hypothetical protein